MRPYKELAVVGDLFAEGLNDCEIARRTGIPRRTVHGWRCADRPARIAARTGCEACGHPTHAFEALPGEAYAHLLGLYLGDGHIVHMRRGVYRLSVALDERYMEIVASCARSMQDVIGKAPGIAFKPGCITVNAYSKQWPCLFPQHGPGVEHLRRIALVDWQRSIVDAHPRALLRGLVESDGCRFINRVVVNGKAYEYPRYTFTNASDDIRRIFTDACDAIGVEWRRMNARNISVARRASVAALDEFIGPKA